MNREREYRAWHKESMQMLHGTPKDIFQWLQDGQPIVVMDWTGIKDMNDGKVYEGDMVDYGYKKSVVVWYEGGWYSAGVTELCCEDVYAGKSPYKVYKEGGNCVEMDTVKPPSYVSKFEIIGNIYENPELLK